MASTHNGHGTIPPHRTLRIGTRSSQLALKQVDLFISLLKQTHPNITTSIHATNTSLGDVDKTTSLHTLATAAERTPSETVSLSTTSSDIGTATATKPVSSTKSLWTSELETMLAENKVDLLVHSMKDVPTTLPPGLLVRAVGPRAESSDCLILSPTCADRLRSNPTYPATTKEILTCLPSDTRIGTSSVRRTAMIRKTYPHLRIVDCRGNVPTRLSKLDASVEPQFDALVLAAAGVHRLGLSDRICGLLGEQEGILHAVGQGAIGIEWRANDVWITSVLDSLDVSPTGDQLSAGRRTRLETVAERSLLRLLEGGCSVPVGVQGSWSQKCELTMRGMVVSLDGQKYVERSREVTVCTQDAAEVQEKLVGDCGEALARELLKAGAHDILKAIRAG